jgi:hypothetical protein
MGREQDCFLKTKLIFGEMIDSQGKQDAALQLLSATSRLALAITSESKRGFAALLPPAVAWDTKPHVTDWKGC